MTNIIAHTWAYQWRYSTRDEMLEDAFPELDYLSEEAAVHLGRVKLL